MKTFDIGPGVTCDPDVLLNTRLLIQANSGGGKSWALRRVLEQTHGHVQQLVIDPEGEFATLRERFDYVLAAKGGGDTAATPRTARLLAERLLELGVSAVLDIYELQAHERVQFVQAFFEALVDAPKRLWHPALVVLDEAHVFAPEKGSAASLRAVIDLATRGRKRGFCLVQATQRLSKLHKDAAAEMNNKLIGRSSLDVDMDRAGDELGFSKADRTRLRTLEAGEFYAFGPALTRTVTRVRVGPVQTSHPKAGSKLAGVVPPPTEKVRAVLSNLADLPAEAEQQARTVGELKTALGRAEVQLAATTKKLNELQARHEKTSGSATSNEVGKTEVPVLTDADRELLRTLQTRIGDHLTFVSSLADGLRDRLSAALAAALDDAVKRHNALIYRAEETFAQFLDRKGLPAVFEKLDRVTASPAPRLPGHRSHLVPTLHVSPSRNPGIAVPGPTRDAIVKLAQHVAAAGDMKLGKCERAILRVLANQPEGCPASKLTLLAGYTWSGTFSNAVGALRTAGYLAGPNTGVMHITGAGRQAIGPVEPLPEGPELQHYWLTHPTLGKAERQALAALLQAPAGLDRDALCAATGYTFSGTFSNALGKLRTLGLIEGRNTEIMRASPVLLEAA